MPASVPPVVALLSVVGTLEAASLILTIWVIVGRRNLSKAVKLYIMADLITRLLFAISRFNRVICILTWHCVSTDGYPFSWLMLNLITSAFEFGLELMLKLVAVAFSVNRFFAVYFNGLYYSRFERSAFLQCFLLTIFPAAAYLVSIGTLTNKSTDYVCYGGTFFNPANYLFTWFYSWKPGWTNTWELVAESWVVPISGVSALILDLLTMLKIRQMKRFVDSKQKIKGDRTLLIMIFITHLITMIRWMQNKVIRIDVRSDYEHTILNQYYYATIPVTLFRFGQT
ncbi:unnamed protein product, partial [Mesorhabditis belari]|uniref:Uncharacterized protein n=1 Tax=Mesorhabditis belari TaxID=2138241 RepID=A0AAF3J3G1_9BILA